VIRHESFSPAETVALAESLARKARPGDVLCLCGPLGAGKTAFAQGFARGLGIARPVTSPTFTLVQVYEEGRLPLYHFDLYRLISDGAVSEEALDDIGFEEYIEGEGVCLVEWAEEARAWLPPGATWVRIAGDAARGEGYRCVEIEEAPKI